MNTIGKDVITPKEKQNDHDKKWGMYVSIVIGIVQPPCECGATLVASDNTEADLFCIACNNEYIIFGDNQLERVNNEFLNAQN